MTSPRPRGRSRTGPARFAWLPRRNAIPAWSHTKTQGLWRRSAVVDYGIALGAVGAALLVRWWLGGVLGDRVPFLLTTAALLPLVVLVRPGAFLAAAFVGLFGSWFLFLAPGGRSNAASGGELVAMAIYALTVAAAAVAARLAQGLSQRVRDEGDRAERRLQLLELVTDAAPALISYLDRNRRYRFANRYYEEWFGEGRDEVVGKLVHDVLGTAVADQNAPYVERALRGEHVRFEMQARHRTGEVRWIDAQYVPDRASDGSVMGLFVLGLDISERKQAEIALRDETRIAETLNGIGRALGGELDTERIVQLVTDEATALAGAEFGAFFYNLVDGGNESYTLYALSGASREDFERFPMPRNTEIFEPTFRGGGVVRSGDITQDPRYGKNPPYQGLPEGHLPVTSYLAVPVVSRGGEPLGGLFFGHSQADVFTERAERLVVGIAGQASVAIDNARLFATAEEELRHRKEVEAALRQREAELREADRRKDEFLATLAHELRNPLAPIGMATSILRQSREDPTRFEQVTRTIERQVAQLVRLIDDLLDVSRITRGKISLRRERVDLNDVLGQALESAQPLLAKRALRLSVSRPTEPVLLDADSTRLVQVVGNLLSNACKYTDQGGEVFVEVEKRPGEAVLKVRDTGIGIAPDKLPGLFEMFSQVEGSLDRAQGGLGIGLALSRSLVSLHGGTIQARSPGLGRGSEFEVKLPLAAQTTVKRGGDGTPTRTRTATHRRVLVVDDNEDVRTTTATLLELRGHEVAAAADGVQALELADSWQPEVVLLDIGMPRLDGYEVARRMRREPWGDSVLLVAMTGWGQDKDRKLALEAGFDAHVTKPADPERLDELLGTAPRHAAPADAMPLRAPRR